LVTNLPNKEKIIRNLNIKRSIMKKKIEVEQLSMKRNEMIKTNLLNSSKIVINNIIQK
jgi:hypothetical protein